VTRRILAVVVGLLLGLTLLEIGFRIGGAVVSGRAERGVPARPAAGDTFRVLCVGDSNTYGGGVERREAYPARLEDTLNRAAGRRRFVVTNLGVPGTNSAQLLHRLPAYIASYAPDLLIVLIGVNDYWNPAETVAVPGGGVRRWVHRVLSHLRVYRFFHLTVLAGGPPWIGPAGEPGRSSTSGHDAAPVVEITQRGPDDGGEADATHRELRYGGATFSFRIHRRAVVLDDAEHRSLLRQHLRGIVDVAAAARVPLVLPTYAADWGHYEVANAGIVSLSGVAGAHVVSQVFGAQLAHRIPRSKSEGSLFFPDLHPKPPVYEAYALSLCEALVRERLIPLEGCEPPPG
jgi:hypothetical protein